MIDRELVGQLAQEVANEWQMGGLAGTMYENFAAEVVSRYQAHEILRIWWKWNESGESDFDLWLHEETIRQTKTLDTVTISRE